MVSRFTTTRILKIAVPALVAIFCVNSVLPAAARTRRVRPISKPKFDPAAKQVELFKGMKDGSLAARLILKNSREGNLLIQNKTDQPLTVKLPDAFVGVQVLKQGVVREAAEGAVADSPPAVGPVAAVADSRVVVLLVAEAWECSRSRRKESSGCPIEASAWNTGNVNPPRECTTQ